MWIIAYQGIFKRKELKYMLDTEQYMTVLSLLEGRMKLDEYGHSLICSLYFDTPDFRLIRTSMQKPTYKEKLRLRTYGTPSDSSIAFAEIKKKYKGIVYKRRVMLPYADALSWLTGEREYSEPCQISLEIDYLRDYYAPLAPACVLCYDRDAYYSAEDEGLRITFDTNVRYRFFDLDLRSGDSGERITGAGQYLVEVEIAGGMPMWLAGGLCEAGIFPISFSKYAHAYMKKPSEILIHTKG